MSKHGASWDLQDGGGLAALLPKPLMEKWFILSKGPQDLQRRP